MPPPPNPHRRFSGQASSDPNGSQVQGRRPSAGERRGFEPHHAGVPKATDLAGKFAEHCGPPTTVMLRNIPNKYVQDVLLEEIDDVGFRGAYDFFYLPMDIRNNANVGYAFVNLTSNAEFQRFRQAFEGYQFKRAASRKVAAVSPATVQGLKANVQNLVRKRVAQGEHRPFVLQQGRRVELDDVASELERCDGPELDEVRESPARPGEGYPPGVVGDGSGVCGPDVDVA